MGDKDTRQLGFPNSSSAETHAFWLYFHVATKDTPQEFFPITLLVFVHQTLIP